ncbi:MAG: YbaB/EbfC family nucleoid-associated protein [Acidimicrobiales bacterium]|nr:YbaB/EbfC family nucleoid-associated protein [Acidimicrobiales bacterium]
MSEPTDPGGQQAFPDLGGLLAQAQQMQQQLIDAQAEAASAVVEGSAGGGSVTIEVTGGLDFRSVRIDPSVVDPDDPSLLEDLVLAALHDAVARINEMQEGAMGGLDLGGIADAFGGPEMDETMGGLGGLLGPGSSTEQDD